jgi:membrane associated rhomboid family serine protease
MLRFHSQNPPLELDACKTCGAVWFDPQEFETVPEGAIASTHEVRLRGAEALGTYRLEQLKEKGVTDSAPDETWKWIPALFGFPVEAEVNPVTRLPWVTWSLAVVILAISVGAFFDLDNVVERFGFIPAAAWRYGGLTSLTSFFLHGGILHLVGNLYFFLIFGDNVEDYLGRWRYVLLILASTLTGDLTYALAQPHSTLPAIGASGGISGIIVFYALEFPQARLGFLFGYFLYFRWIQMPAWGALVLWVLMQFIGAAMQLGGFSNVAATAHLGGAAAGFALWYWWRKIKLRPAAA